MTDSVMIEAFACPLASITIALHLCNAGGLSNSSVAVCDPDNLERIMSDQPTGTARIILPEGLTWEQVHLAVEIIQNWEIAGSSDAVELVVGLYKLIQAGFGSRRSLE